MAALDDYERPLPLWLMVCRVLELHAGGLSVTQTHAAIVRLYEERAPRPASVSELLARMREDGTCAMRRVRRGRQVAHVHTLTVQGRELFDQARCDVARLLFDEAATGGRGGEPKED